PGPRMGRAIVVGYGQGDIVGTRRCVAVARIARTGAGTVTEVPRARDDAAIAVAGAVGEARRQSAGGESEVRGGRRIARHAVAAGEADATERRIGLQSRVVGSGLGGGDRAGLRVAAGVGSAVVAGVGGSAAELHVHVGIAGATRHAEVQAGRTGRYGQRVVDRIARRLVDAGDRDAIGERATGGAASATPAATRTAHADAAERAGHRRSSESEIGGRGFDAASAVVECAAGRPVERVGSREYLERVGRVPAGRRRQFIERLVVHTR